MDSMANFDFLNREKGTRILPIDRSQNSRFTNILSGKYNVKKISRLQYFFKCLTLIVYTFIIACSTFIYIISLEKFRNDIEVTNEPRILWILNLTWIFMHCEKGSQNSHFRNEYYHLSKMRGFENIMSRNCHNCNMSILFVSHTNHFYIRLAISVVFFNI